jgi:hypothetical protein
LTLSQAGIVLLNVRATSDCDAKFSVIAWQAIHTRRGSDVAVKWKTEHPGDDQPPTLRLEHFGLDWHLTRQHMSCPADDGPDDPVNVDS